MKLTHGKGAHDHLFDALDEIAGKVRSDFNCSITGSNGDVSISITDPKTDRELWAYTGSRDSALRAFQLWVRDYQP